MNIQKIKHFIHLVYKERTGSPEEAAKKIAVSDQVFLELVVVLSVVELELRFHA